VDEQTLHPEMQFLLAARDLRGGRPLHEGTPPEARKRMRDEAVRYSLPPLPLSVRDFEIPGAAGPLRVRHYAPQRETGGALPLLVFLHGGAFVTGDLDSHDEPCRILCDTGRAQVLAIDYRLAPEHPFPAAIDDAFAAFRWALAHAAELGADPKSVGIGGDSAGGNLAAVVAQLGRDAGTPPAFQLLIYPAVDRVGDHASLTKLADGFFLTSTDIAWGDDCYVGSDKTLRRDPRISPLLAKDLSGLCPAMTFTAGFDPLRDEGEAYAQALARAGCESSFRRFPGMIHGFLNMGGVSPAARAAVRDIALGLRDLSRRVGTTPHVENFANHTRAAAVR
jgi:acetyl esterase